MPQDALGNDLKVGQLVRVKLQEAAGIGYIYSLKEPSVNAITEPGQKPQMSPGLLRIRLSVDIAYIPGRGGQPMALNEVLLLIESEAMQKDKLESAVKLAQA